MTNIEIKTEKKRLRSFMKFRRALLTTEYLRQSDEGILYRLRALESYRKAAVIFSYVSMPEEVDTRRFIREALQEGKGIVVPRCEEGGIMNAYRIGSLDDLEPGAWGIWEPKRQCPKIQPDIIDLCVVPCVSASRTGVRLGYGGGYYDRYLPRTEAVRVLLCREQMLCEEIPEEAHDCRMDVVVTEEAASCVKGSCL